MASIVAATSSTTSYEMNPNRNDESRPQHVHIVVTQTLWLLVHSFVYSETSLIDKGGRVLLSVTSFPIFTTVFATLSIKAPPSLGTADVGRDFYKNDAHFLFRSTHCLWVA